MVTASLVFATIFGDIWTVIVWIIAGGIAGAITDRIVQGNRLGCLGNVAVGVVGGLLFGFIVDLIFNIQISGVFWTFVAALVGSAILLLIVNLITGKSDIGDRQHNTELYTTPEQFHVLRVTEIWIFKTRSTRKSEDAP
jgi:uncharacterized membrane protein YeaQ/YmgE (transglycosylase-associated protein family)